MKRNNILLITSTLFICLITQPIYCKKKPVYQKKKKIVALIPARNESLLIGQCIQAVSLYADAIVYLDDCSDDNSVEIVKSLSHKFKVEKIIEKRSWYRDEPGDRNALLQAGRKIGGTHFIVIDADEMLTANFLENNYLKKRIMALKPGDQLVLNWIQLWRDYRKYRFDDSVWTWNYKSFIFCDDQECSYKSNFIHTSRCPSIHGKVCKISGYEYGMLHFQFVNWRNLLVKQAWYRCLERIRTPEKSPLLINDIYNKSKDESNIGLKSCPPEWFENYYFFNPSIFEQPERWREKQILEWCQQYGYDYFKELDIWDIDWNQNL